MNYRITTYDFHNRIIRQFVIIGGHNLFIDLKHLHSDITKGSINSFTVLAISATD